MLSEHRARSFRHDERDAFHPWTIAQNETDYWLRSIVQYLASLSTRTEEERNTFGAKLVDAYATFPRRRMSAHLQIQDLERLLSLPAWKRRYEFYGVWIATEIVAALDGHDIVINHSNGELKFGFAEAKIADVKTARPKVSLFAERRAPLAAPVGENRVSAVQPDYGLWTPGLGSDKCIMIVEVKHYKRRSRQNFRAALIDYARAHPRARVLLVNYGPVGSAFADLPSAISSRCTLIGHLNPEDGSARDNFREIVRTCVGNPVPIVSHDERVASAEAIVIDTSQSMSKILSGEWFWDFIDNLEDSSSKIALVDDRIREIESYETLKEWFSTHELGSSTSLSGPVSELLERHERIVVITDLDGLNSLSDLNATIVEVDVKGEPGARLLQISKVSS